MGWSWSKFKVGLRYPTGFGLGTNISKTWATYADSAILLDASDDLLCALENKKCGNVIYSQQKFAPFDQNFYTYGYYSYKDKFTVGGTIQGATYWQKFPSYPGIGRDEPHPNLYPMGYRLGLSRMPGYGYSLPYYTLATVTA